jgi:hypothetical protein
VTVLVNSDFSNAFTAITGQITDLILPPAPADAAEVAKTAAARKLFDMLRTGALDRRLMTENANYYFTDIALGDYRQSLSALGEPKSFEAVRKPRLRGGFVNRNYRVSYGGQVLNIITYSEPGDNGRFEQFLVMPTQ